MVEQKPINRTLGNAAEAEIIGDVVSNKVGIKMADLDFIVGILSTNLYSKPIDSLIREIVSNAEDSNNEAGSNEPILIMIGENVEKSRYFSVRDFGTGLSPQRFDDVYRNIGSSSKRTQAGQIGKFGIGKFSVLAYNDMSNITSFYKGKKYEYLMYKNGNSLSIDLLSTVDTDEPDGLEVKISIKEGDTRRFVDSIEKQLVYFENLHVEFNINEDDLRWDENSLTDSITDFNDRKIKEYTHFYASKSSDNYTHLTIGKVSYPIRRNTRHKLSDLGIGLKFDIDAIEVTPNREEVIYNTETDKLIQDKLDLALEEIKVEAIKQSKKDVDTVTAYMSAYESPRVILYDDVELSLNTFGIVPEVTLKGKTYDGPSINALYYRVDIHSTSVKHISSDRIADTHINVKRQLQDNTILNADVASLSPMTKKWLRETKTGMFITNLDARMHRRVLKRFYSNYVEGANTTKETRLFILNYLKKLYSDSEVITNASVPQSFIDAEKAKRVKKVTAKKAGIKWSEEINLFHARDSYGSSITFDSRVHKLKNLHKKFKCLTVYADKNEKSKINKIRRLTQSSAHFNVRYVGVAPTKLKILKDIDNFVHIDDFMDTKYKAIRKIGTIEYIREHLKYRHFDWDISFINPELKKVTDSITDYLRADRYYSTYRSDSFFKQPPTEMQTEIYELCKDKGYFDEEMKALIDANLKELNNLALLEHFSSTNKKAHNLIVDYLKVRQMVRPGITAINKLAETGIFNIVKEVEEDKEEEDEA